MTIHFCMPTFNQPTLLGRAVSAALQSDVELTVTVVDISPDSYAHRVLDYYTNDDRVRVITLPANPGLAGVWNLCFSMYDDYVIMSNDDVFVEPHTVREMVGAAQDFDDALFFGDHDAFSFFLLKKQAYLQVGAFDVAYWPLYWDDVDYAYRLKLLGLTSCVVTTATIEHVGSASLKAYDSAAESRHHARFRRNETYYTDKWAGRPGHETAKIPFGGALPFVPPFIGKEK